MTSDASAGATNDSAPLQRRIAELEAEVEKLRESEKEYRVIFENLHDAYYRTDLAGTIIVASPSAEKIFGYTVQEAIGMNLARDFYEDPKRREEFLRLMKENGSVREFEAPLRRKDGSTIWVSTNASFFRDAGGDIAGIEGIARDITERKESDERLRRMQKLEAIGALAGSVAHDYSNLFTSILGYASILSVKEKGNKEVARAAEVITNAARKASDLTKQLLTLARKGRLMTVPVDTHEVVRNVTGKLARIAGDGVEISCELCAPSSTVNGDPQQLEQVLLHLGTNSCEAMGCGGTIVFATENVDVGEDHLKIDPSATPGRHVAISIRDSGPGVPADVRERAFDPFFTTKESTDNIGLGLSMAFGIAKNHGGSISLLPDEGDGAEFRILIPVAKPRGTISERGGTV